MVERTKPFDEYLERQCLPLTRTLSFTGGSVRIDNLIKSMYGKHHPIRIVSEFDRQ